MQQLLTHGLNGTGVSAEWIHVAAVALGIAIQLPLCVYGNFRTISGFSFTGCLTTAAVMLLILFLPVLDPHKQHLNEDPSHHALSISIVPATSIFAVRPSPLYALCAIIYVLCWPPCVLCVLGVLSVPHAS